jgi:plastocyanin
MDCFPRQLPDVRSAAITALLLCSVACESHVAAPERPVAAAVRTAAVAAQPVRGTVHEVHMLLDNEGFRFEPGYLTVQEGDGVRFLMVSGVPHNVAFDERFIPRGSRAQLAANLAALGARDLAAPVVTTVDSGFVISTSGLPHGDYLFYCAPHRSLNMHGVLSVR